MSIDLTSPIFHDEEAARAHFEALRWPHGPTCPHCGAVKAFTRMEGKAHRTGAIQCNACREQYSVTVGSVMERSHVPLAKWALAFYLMAASKKGISAHQLHRTIKVTYKTAWFMAHRIREAMTDKKPTPLGGTGKIVEADEMYHGKVESPQPLSRGRIRNPTKSGKAGGAQKRVVIGLVERGGEARAIHLRRVTGENVREIIVTHADRASRLQTDESRLYPKLGREFAAHETVNHGAKEYARGDVTTNSVEGFFGIFKRGIVGVYQHCGEQHLQRYLNEFTFRYSHRAKFGVTDSERACIAILGAEGKRLTYQAASEA